MNFKLMKSFADSPVIKRCSENIQNRIIKFKVTYVYCVMCILCIIVNLCMYYVCMGTRVGKLYYTYFTPILLTL